MALTLSDAHDRLLSGTEEAADEMARLLLPVMARGLRFRFPGIDADLVNDAAVDGILAFFRSPQRFDQRRASLETYLMALATNRLRDLLRRDARRRRAEWHFSVAVSREASQDAVLNTRHLDVDRIASTVCRSTLERTFLSCWFEGRCAGDLAGLLGVLDQSLQGQRRCLNRMKGRLSGRIRRVRAAYRAERKM